jgi:hypothetical protein
MSDRQQTDKSLEKYQKNRLAMGLGLATFAILLLLYALHMVDRIRTPDNPIIRCDGLLATAQESYDRGKLGQATEELYTALEEMKKYNYSVGMARGLVLRAKIEHKQGDASKATQTFIQAYKLAEYLLSPDLKLLTMKSIAEFYVAQGKSREALALAASILREYDATGKSRAAINFLLRLGEHFAQASDLVSAQKLYEQAKDRLQDDKQFDAAALVDEKIADAWLHKDQHVSLQHYVEALNQYLLLQKPDEAEKIRKKIDKLDSRILGEIHE